MIPVFVTMSSKPISLATARPWVRTETDRSQRARRRTGPLEARDRLDVVVEDVRLRLDDGADVVRATVEVADEHLDARAGVLEPDLADRLRDHLPRRRRAGRRARPS